MLNKLYDTTAKIFAFPDPQDSITRFGESSTSAGIPIDTGRTLRTTLQTPRTRMADLGAGESAVGYMNAYVDFPSPVKFNEVIYCVDGPNAGTWWTVVSIFGTYKSHHVELVLQPLLGQTPQIQ